MKTIQLRLNEHASLEVRITPEMQKDWEECKADSQIPGGTGKDCDSCSMHHTNIFGQAFCEIPAITDWM